MKLVLTILFCAGWLVNYSQQNFDVNQKIELIDQATRDCDEKNNSELRAIYDNWLSRMTIGTAQELQIDSEVAFVNVNSHQGRNKCNPDYNYNAGIQGFNPLMYHLHFETKSEMIYRIGTTDYFLLIAPKN